MVGEKEQAEIMTLLAQWGHRAGMPLAVPVVGVDRQAKRLLTPRLASQLRRDIVGQFRYMEEDPDLQLATYGAPNRYGLI